MFESVTGHVSTLGAFVRRRLPRPPEPASVEWGTTVDDPEVGAVQLTGELSRIGSEGLLILLHGLGGSNDSLYVRSAANAALARGLSVLRLNMRGADRECPDFYHAALTSDLHTTLQSTTLTDFERVYVLGFSLGGHVALRFVAESVDVRVRAVASACSPLDLARCADVMDRPSMGLYRSYMLRKLVEMFEVVAAHRAMPVSVEEVSRIRYMREWDERVVAPRHGFAGAADYYDRASAGPCLSSIRTRTLVLAAENDPMIPAASLRPFMLAARSPVEGRWVKRGGHLGFSSGFDLGQPGAKGFDEQILTWLLSPGG